MAVTMEIADSGAVARPRSPSVEFPIPKVRIQRLIRLITVPWDYNNGKGRRALFRAVRKVYM
jgi:hypothetical protein